jgi:diguanylate cyclase (GGDEF)-like protein/PAS domain S-box-containing protein
VTGLVRWLLEPGGFTPHGFCLLWNPGLLWTHALSDLFTGAAYAAISLALAGLVRRRPDLMFRPVAWLFITFILFCGITHWLDLLTLWVPAYGLQAVVKAATASVSVVTAVLLWRLRPAALAQPSLAQFRSVNETLRTNQDFLDRIGRVAGVGGWEFDVASGRVTWSAETYRIHGMPPDYRPTIDDGLAFYAPEARPIIGAALEKGVAEGAGWDLELPFDRADGGRIWVRTVGSPTFTDGRPVRITGAFQDITDLRAARVALQRASERAVLATESGRIGIWEWDIARGAMVWDAWMYRLYGMEPRGEIVAQDLWNRHLHPEDRAAAEEMVLVAIRGLEASESEYRIVWADGSVHHIRAAAHITRDDRGRATRMIGANWDVTDAKRLAADLAQQHALLKVTLDSIGDGVITTDPEARVTWLNPVAEQMTGWTVDEAAARPLAEVFKILPDERGAKTPGSAKGGVLVARDGREFAIEETASPIRGGQGGMLGTVVVFHDVTEQRRLSREMSYRASHDPLTGLVNRREFELRLTRALHKAKAEGVQGAVIYVDLDRFKTVNDTCGHDVGDDALVQVAAVLAGSVRANDTIARLGGDEFGILLEICPLDQAHRLAETLCQRMNDFRFVHGALCFRIGASLGLAPIDARWTSVAAIQKAADGACYAAKGAGGNCVHICVGVEPVEPPRRRLAGA